MNKSQTKPEIRKFKLNSLENEKNGALSKKYSVQYNRSINSSEWHSKPILPYYWLHRNPPTFASLGFYNFSFNFAAQMPQDMIYSFYVREAKKYPKMARKSWLILHFSVCG